MYVENNFIHASFLGIIFLIQYEIINIDEKTEMQRDLIA